MSEQSSPFPSQSGSCFVAGDTVASWGRGERRDVPGHQKSSFRLVFPITVSSSSVSSFSG